MRGTRSIVVIVALIVGTDWGSEARLGDGLSAAIGRGANPLRVSQDGPDGTFTRLALDGSVSHLPGPAVASFADFGGLDTSLIQRSGGVLYEVDGRERPHFEVVTPYRVAGARGTEFLVTVNRDCAAVTVRRTR